ncbi:MAG TPA: hypothetical protein VI078_04625 [bacterium]
MRQRLSGPSGRRCLFFVLAIVLPLSQGGGPSPAFAHGGPPLRIGVAGDPDAAAAARLALVHLREGVGFAVDWREFPDEDALRAAFSGGRLDIAAAVSRPAGAPAAGTDCPPAEIGRIREEIRGRWGGEAFLLRPPTGADPCARCALVVSRTVLADLRFTILGREMERLAAVVAAEDLAAVRAAAVSGGERAATAAARAALAAKAGK